MHDSFGARLRHQREKKGVSLRTIANQTKIKLSLLEGLERDDIRYWPAGIFRRAYLRDYAQAIGLDPDVVVREFVERFPAPVEIPDAPPASTSRLRSLVDSALGSLRPRSSPPSPAQVSGPAEKIPATAVQTSGTLERSAPEPLVELSTFAPVELSAPAEKRPSPLRVRAPKGETRSARPIRPAASADARPADEPVAEDPTPSSAASAKADIGGGWKRRAGDRESRPSEAGSRVPDLLAAARICTELGRVEHTRQVPPLLREAAGVLGAKGLIVWVWDALSEELKPALALGYPTRVLSQLGGLRRDADNATADAFRSAEARALGGALVVPLLTPAACAGVLAIELSNAGRPAPPVMAIATILAAMLAQLIGTTTDSDAPA